MTNKRALAIQTIRMLFLASLLLCFTTVKPRERIDSHEKNRPLTLAPALMFAKPVSSDGLIAFSATGQIYVMNPDGSNLTRVTDGDPGVINVSPTLSPDGSRLAYVRVDRTGHFLYVVGVDGSHQQLLTGTNSSLSDPAWSPDGSKIAFVRGYDTTGDGFASYTPCGAEIYAIDVASGKEMSLTKGEGGVDPSWSPDGTQIAFSRVSDNNYDIYTMNSVGGDVQRLTRTDWAEAEPAWSPDGKRIAYTAHMRRSDFVCGFMPTGRPPESKSGEITGIYIMSVDGSEQTDLTTTSGAIQSAWSPDGTSLVLVINDSRGDSQIYVVDADGMNLTKLTSDSAQKSSPSWSSAAE